MSILSEFGDDYNATSFNDQSSCFGRYRREMSDAVITTYYIILYASLAVGIPGNILSAIVWLRRRKTSSAVYLAALAIIDLVYLLVIGIYYVVILRLLYDVVCGDRHSWLCSGTDQLFIFLTVVTGFIEPLLVLSFSVERLIAILRPLKVCRQRALRRELLREQATYDLLYIILIRH